MEPKTYTTESNVPLIEKVFGPSWKTTVSGFGAAIMSFLTILSMVPYELGELSTVIDPAWKARLTLISAIAAFLLRLINSHYTKDRNIHGGNVLVDGQGTVVERTVDVPTSVDSAPKI